MKFRPNPPCPRKLTKKELATWTIEQKQDKFDKEFQGWLGRAMYQFYSTYGMPGEIQLEEFKKRPELWEKIGNCYLSYFKEYYE